MFTQSLFITWACYDPDSRLFGQGHLGKKLSGPYNRNVKAIFTVDPPPPLQINYFIFCRWINLENGLQAILISDLLEGEEEAEEAPWDDEDEEEHDGNDETEMEEDEEEEDSENEEGGEKKVQF